MRAIILCLVLASASYAQSPVGVAWSWDTKTRPFCQTDKQTSCVLAFDIIKKSTALGQTRTVIVRSTGTRHAVQRGKSTLYDFKESLPAVPKGTSLQIRAVERNKTGAPARTFVFAAKIS